MLVVDIAPIALHVLTIDIALFVLYISHCTVQELTVDIAPMLCSALHVLVVDMACLPTLTLQHSIIMLLSTQCLILNSWIYSSDPTLIIVFPLLYTDSVNQ